VNTGERRAARRGPVAIATLALVVAGMAGCGPAIPSPLPPDPATVGARITVDGLHAHLEALDRIARENGGSHQYQDITRFSAK